MKTKKEFKEERKPILETQIKNMEIKIEKIKEDGQKQVEMFEEELQTLKYNLEAITLLK